MGPLFLRGARDAQTLALAARRALLASLLAIPAALFAQTPQPSGRISAAGVVNAASFVSGPVAPGELVTIFGVDIGPPALTLLQLNSAGLVEGELAETRALFDGIPAPLVYAQASQVAAVVPYAVAGRTRVSFQVEYLGVRSNAVNLDLAAAAPGIFTLNSSGRGPGAIVNQDGTVNSAANPARVGSTVAIFATGEGQTEPAGVDGKLAVEPLPRPRLPVSVLVAGAPAQVLYAGAAPGLVAGVLQINAVIPSGVAAGNAVPVMVTIGGAASQSSVTLAIAPPARLVRLEVTPAAVTEGGTVTGVVTLSAPAPAPITVLLASSSPAAQPPATVTVPAGQASASFPIATRSPGTVTITATHDGVFVVAALTIRALGRSPFADRSLIRIEGTFTSGAAQAPVQVAMTRGGADAHAALLFSLSPLVSLTIRFRERRFAESSITFPDLDPQAPNVYSAGLPPEAITSASLSLTFAAPSVGAGVSGLLRFSTANRTVEGLLTGRITVLVD